MKNGDAPDVGGANIRISAEIIQRGEGVLLAHGGTVHGYALFVRDNALHFAVRVVGELRTLNAPLPPGEGLHIMASLSKDGTMALELNDDAPAVTGKAAAPLNTTPADAFSVGHDFNDAVGDYQAPFAFTGKLGAVMINLSR